MWAFTLVISFPGEAFVAWLGRCFVAFPSTEEVPALFRDDLGTLPSYLEEKEK